jgi:hypothetical protein
MDILSRGLTHEQIIEVLDKAGARSFSLGYVPEDKHARSFQKFVYASVESGYPAVLVFQTASSMHAIPVLGHTFNEDSWKPNAESAYFKPANDFKYIPSESWVSTYVAHDDNFGPNFCLPRNYLNVPHWGATASETVSYERNVVHAVSTFPKKVQMWPVSAEKIGAEVIWSLIQTQGFQKIAGEWGKRLAERAKYGELVLRPVLVDEKEYVSHLEKAKTWEGQSLGQKLIDVFKAKFPSGLYWMIEVSLPELFYANRRKVAEVLVRAQLGTGLADIPELSVLSARFPGGAAFLLPTTGWSLFQDGPACHVPLFGCEDWCNKQYAETTGASGDTH